MKSPLRSRQIEIVVKITKFCNLRCTYCYEFPFLAQKGVVPLKQLERLFGNVVSFERQSTDSTQAAISFVWHGGEPFTVPFEYYEEIGRIQRRVLGRHLTFENSVQTNLTILTDAQLEALKDQHFFNSIGFSFDVYGDQRVDTAGRSSTNKVIANMERLRAEEIATGGIVVLSRSTHPKIKSIYRFYEELGYNFRILPYHIETLPGQSVGNALEPREIAQALCDVFDVWFQSETPVNVAPLEHYITSALAYTMRNVKTFYSKAVDESVFVVDMDGTVSGYETYTDELRYGNIFEQSFDEILLSDGRQRAIEAADARMRTHCTDCRFYGWCSGQPVAEANVLEEVWLKEQGCYVATVVEHIVERLAGVEAAVWPAVARGATARDFDPAL